MLGIVRLEYAYKGCAGTGFSVRGLNTVNGDHTWCTRSMLYPRGASPWVLLWTVNCMAFTSDGACSTGMAVAPGGVKSGSSDAVSAAGASTFAPSVVQYICAQARNSCQPRLAPHSPYDSFASRMKTLLPRLAMALHQMCACLGNRPAWSACKHMTKAHLAMTA